MTRHSGLPHRFVSAALPSQLKPCRSDGNPKCRHCERSEAIQQDQDAFFKTIWIATSAAPSGGTTGKTTSHLTNSAKDAEQVIGYSQSTKPASWQVAGYRNDDVFWIPACLKDSLS
jgi:hypothetical protein